jgi:pimeloyl-ACP methyl ester carboxylesterase
MKMSPCEPGGSIEDGLGTMNARIRYVLISVFIVLVVLVLAGATYQGVATALERRRYPHPGRLIDVGGHQLHIYCLGTGSPTVMLEAPAAGMSAAWGWVQPEVAKATRVCSYDRAGLGWSEAGDKPYDPGRVPEELHTLLAAAKEPGPYVLAGQALGASFVRTFSSLYPADTAALVLIDSRRDEPSANTRFFTMSPWLARMGLLRATGALSPNWEGLPGSSAGAVSTFLNRPDHLTRALREVARSDDAIALASKSRPPGTLLVMTLDANLNDQADARRVSGAIAALVRQLRGEIPNPNFQIPR